VITAKQISKIKKSVELNCLKYFLDQLKDIQAIPTGNQSDKLYLEFFKFVRKVENIVKKN